MKEPEHQLNAEINHQIKKLPLTLLKEDPLNQEAFSMQELEALAEDIRKDGFFGEISAYPIEDGYYRIESGHRRFRAAQIAGLTELPVSITVPPVSMIERRLRLTQWNQNVRSFTPMDVAKLVAFTYETQEMMKKQGLVTGSLIELTAKELGISTSNVSKYKMLLSLTTELQSLAASGKYSWAHLAAASQLHEEAQHRLYRNIINEAKIHPITGAWLAKEIDEYKHIRSFSSSASSYGKKLRMRENISQRDIFGVNTDIGGGTKPKEFPDNTQAAEVNAGNAEKTKTSSSSKEKKVRHRRSDGTKGIKRAAALLRDSLSADALIKEKDQDEMIMILHEIQDLAAQGAEDLKNRTTAKRNED